MFAVSVPPIQLIMPIGICDAVHNLWQQDTESSALTSDGWSPRCRGPRNAHGSSSRSPPNFYHRVIATEIGRRQLEEIRITSQLTNPHQRQAVATTHLHHVKQCNVRVVMRLSHHVAFDRNKKRWATDDSSKHKYNIRPIQFRPHWTNPKLGGKQIWIPHAHKSERWLADMLFLGKCVEWFWFWSEGASSELCHKPQCLGLGKFERWWYVRKFPPHHGQPAICLHPANSHITTISVIKYLCEIHLLDIFP